MAAGSDVGAIPSRAVVPSGTQWSITSGEHEAVLVEVGGGLRTYRVAGTDVVDGYADGDMCPYSAGQILAPWPNRVRDGRYVFAGEAYQLALSDPVKHNAIHGLVNWARWQVTDGADDWITLTFLLPAQPGYPWPLQMLTTWTVSATGLRAEHSVTNLAPSPCPFGFAVHPYLFFPGIAVDDLVLGVPARNRLLVDGRGLPIGAARVAGTEFDFSTPRRIGGTVLDTAFGGVVSGPEGDSAATLSTVDGRGLQVWADPAFGWWQIFTSDTLPGERFRRSVAIEPMTCPPDALRSGRDLVVLEPGQTWHGSWGISPQPRPH